jgi:hypothetical protein
MISPWKPLTALLMSACRYISVIPCLFYGAGRDALLRSAEARARSLELDVEHKQLEIEMKRATNILDLIQRVEKIKDPKLREKVYDGLIAKQKILELPKAERLVEDTSALSNF